MNNVQDRDTNGRFVKGNGGGPGRPKKEKEAAYLDILLSVVTPDDWRKVCAVALARAKSGDAKARDWLSNYIVGRPVERHEVSGPNGAAIDFNIAWGDYAASDGASPETA